ncbi:MAG: MBOAT family protein [Rickettsiales bacterium]|nr:MAG: MBOAT family protein [Rickettsiales bacterium]
MVFTTPTFLFILLPFFALFNAFLLIFKLEKVKKYVSVNSTTLQNALLFVVNLLFYAWSDLRAISIILPLSFVTFVGGLAIEKLSFKKTALWFFVIIDTCILAFFKYWKIEGIIVPMGISFIYFRLISYMADVYFKKITEQDFYNFLHYIMFFPQVLMGPIARYTDFNNELQNRTIDFEQNIVVGSKRFIFGLAKKVLIADTLGTVVSKIFALEVIDFGSGIAWIGALFYTLQLYYDFSGFIDMSIGIANIIGFKNVPENFDYPYISKSITEFWRRWHSTLGAWFRDYVYVPLGGNRCSKFRMYLNLWVVFLLTGIWHGNTNVFLIWGIWHGFFNCLEKATGWNKPKENKYLSGLQHVYCLLVVVLGWVLFRSPNLTYSIGYIKNMFGVLPNVVEQYNLWYYLDRMEMLAFAIGVLCMFPLFKKMKEGSNIFINIYIIFLLLVSISFVAANTYQSFLYFQF